MSVHIRREPPEVVEEKISSVVVSPFTLPGKGHSIRVQEYSFLGVNSGYEILYCKKHEEPMTYGSVRNGEHDDFTDDDDITLVVSLDDLKQFANGILDYVEEQS